MVNKLKSLGIQLRCARKMTNDVANERIRKGITISRRIRWAPLPLQTKASLIACLVGPIAMYGFPAGGFASKLVNSLRTAVVTALWGTKRRSRCREIVLTLFVKGHLVDPLQNASYQCLRQLRRMAEQRPETFAELERVWQSYANGGGSMRWACGNSVQCAAGDGLALASADSLCEGRTTPLESVGRTRKLVAT